MRTLFELTWEKAAPQQDSRISSTAGHQVRCLGVHHQIFWAFVSMKENKYLKVCNSESEPCCFNSGLHKRRMEAMHQALETIYFWEKTFLKTKTKTVSSQVSDNSLVQSIFTYNCLLQQIWISEVTYWRVFQRFPFWTFLLHRVVSHPLQVSTPTKNWTVMNLFLYTFGIY